LGAVGVTPNRSSRNATVALFIRKIIDDSVTTISCSAIGPTESIGGVTVSVATITLFSIINFSVPTIGLAGGGARFAITVVSTIIAFLSIIRDRITAFWLLAVWTTKVWDFHVQILPIITVFLLVNNIITAMGFKTVRSASIWLGIIIFGSVIALLDTIQSPITTFKHAKTGTTISVLNISIITLLPWINNSIAASRESTIFSAHPGSICILGSGITLLSDVLDSVTTFSESAVGTAAVGFSGIVTVSGSVIAIFAEVSSQIFDSSVTTHGSRELREVVLNLVHKLIAVRAVVTPNVEKDGNNQSF